MSDPQWIQYKKAFAAIPTGQRYAPAFEHGAVAAGIYAPHESDDRDPLEHDALYFVVDGMGFFRVGSDKKTFGVGDMLFAPAGSDHAFEGFTPNFAVWMVTLPPA